MKKKGMMKLPVDRSALEEAKDQFCYRCGSSKIVSSVHDYRARKYASASAKAVNLSSSLKHPAWTL